jgi:hypothetical protein
MPHALSMPAPGFQAIILCGPGSSFPTFTANPDENPKALIPIANRPMVWYPIDFCYRMGVTSESKFHVGLRCPRVAMLPKYISVLLSACLPSKLNHRISHLSGSSINIDVSNGYNWDGFFLREALYILTFANPRIFFDLR